VLFLQAHYGSGIGSGIGLKLEKIHCMPQENTTHVLYANGNVKLSSMPHVAIFDVLHAISVTV
jgi:hypothetical protein